MHFSERDFLKEFLKIKHHQNLINITLSKNKKNPNKTPLPPKNPPGAPHFAPKFLFGNW
jgi:hypothetical protein